jgi:hypothetical protein
LSKSVTNNILPVTTDIVARFWNWSLSHTADPVPDGCRTGPIPPDEELVFLMDPFDANPWNDPNPPSTIQRCEITSKQKILIPLWIGWTDSSEYPDHSDQKLAHCARGEANLGTITSHVMVDNAPPMGLENPILDHVSLSRLPRLYPHDDEGGIRLSGGQVPPNIEFLSEGFDLHVPEASRKGGRALGGSVPGHKRAASHGFWLLHPPLPPTKEKPHTITYNVLVDTPPNIHGAKSATATDIDYPFRSGNITYQINVK